MKIDTKLQTAKCCEAGDLLVTLIKIMSPQDTCCIHCGFWGFFFGETLQGKLSGIDFPKSS